MERRNVKRVSLRGARRSETPPSDGTLSAIMALADGTPRDTLLPLTDIRVDSDAQSRTGYDPKLLAEYKELMSADDQGRVLDPTGAPWVAVRVYDDGDALWLADGFHRIRVARELGLTHFQATKLRGTRRDAFLYSLQANAEHGKRRTRADKRRAVERALRDPELVRFSDSHLATLCKVTRQHVTKLRDELLGTGTIAYQDVLIRSDGQELPNTRPRPVQPARRAPRAARPSTARPKVLFAEPGDRDGLLAAIAHACGTPELERFALPFPQRSHLQVDAMQATERLTAHGFEPAQALVIDARVCLVWSRGGAELPESLPTLSDLGTLVPWQQD